MFLPKRQLVDLIPIYIVHTKDIVSASDVVTIFIRLHHQVAFLCCLSHQTGIGRKMDKRVWLFIEYERMSVRIWHISNLVATHSSIWGGKAIHHGFLYLHYLKLFSMWANRGLETLNGTCMLDSNPCSLSTERCRSELLTLFSSLNRHRSLSLKVCCNPGVRFPFL